MLWVVHLATKILEGKRAEKCNALPTLVVVFRCVVWRFPSTCGVDELTIAMPA